MNVLLVQIDGKIPNIALMRISAHHQALGDTVRLVFGRGFHRTLFDRAPDKVYASALFQRSRPFIDELLRVYPQAVIGGTGVDTASSLEAVGIHTTDQDYSLYPHFEQSIGFTQRGCRLKCSFCVVPSKEGKVQESQSINEIWRGSFWPSEILLLDNDFFGQPRWKDRIRELQDGRFKVSFNQGINARFLTDETAEAIASVDYRDDSMKVKRIYTAWDNLKDEDRLFSGLSKLVKYGVNPDHIMVYTLIGYWPGETSAERDYRRQKLRDFGARPYPMPYVRSPELVGFQRFVVGAYDKRFTWKQWAGNNFRPEGLSEPNQSLF